MNHDSIRIQSGDKEPIIATVFDEDGKLLPGKTDIKLKIWRASDGYFFDWDDNTFKLPGSVTQMLVVLSPTDVTYAPGEYQLSTPTHARGFNTANIVNPNSFDVYQFNILQDGGTDAVNVPQFGEIHVGGFIDNVDASIAAIDTDLEAIKDNNTGLFGVGDDLHSHAAQFAAILAAQTTSYNNLDDELQEIKDGKTGNYIGTSDSLYHQRLANNIRFDNVDTDLDEIKGAGFVSGNDSLKKQTDYYNVLNSELQNIKDGGLGGFTSDHSLKAIEEEIQAVKGSGFSSVNHSLVAIESKFGAIDLDLELIKDGNTGTYNSVTDNMRTHRILSDSISDKMDLALDGGDGDFDSSRDSLHDLRGEAEQIKDGGDGDYNPNADSLHDRTIADNEIKSALTNIANDIDGIELDIDGIELDLTNIEGKVDANQADLEEIKGVDFLSAEDSLARQTDYSADLYTEIQFMKDNNTGTWLGDESLKSLKTYVENIQTKVEEIQGPSFVPGDDNLHEIQQDIAGVETGIQLVKDNNTGLFTIGDDLHAQRLANEANFDEIDTDLAAIDIDLGNIETNLTTIESKVDANQVDLEEIKGSGFLTAEDGLAKQTDYVNQIDEKLDRAMGGDVPAEFDETTDSLHDIAAKGIVIETKVTNIENDLTEIKGAGFDTGSHSLSIIGDKMPDKVDIARLLGLNHENAFIDNTVHDADAQLVSARLRIFDSKVNAEAATDGGAEITGLVATWNMISIWEGVNKMKTFRMTLEP